MGQVSSDPARWSAIQNSIRAIRTYAGDDVGAVLESGDELARDALLRRLEIIGEAASAMSAEVKDGHPDVPWKGLSKARQIVVHNVFSSSRSGATRAMVEALPALEKASLLELDRLAGRAPEGPATPPVIVLDTSEGLETPTGNRVPASGPTPYGPPRRARWSQRREGTALAVIAESIERIETYVDGAARGDPSRIVEPGLLQDAVQRRIHVICEASAHISPTLRARLQHEDRRLNWGAMRGLRNRLVHHYDEIDNEIIADAVRHHLPVLKRAVGSTMAPPRPGTPTVPSEPIPFDRTH